MASKAAREATQANRHYRDQLASAAGHTLAWRLGDNATRRGHAYFLVGECTQCAAAVTVGPDYSSCPSVRDARRVPCSGPGTAVLTEIEATRSAELVAAAVARFGRALSEGKVNAHGGHGRPGLARIMTWNQA